MPRTKRCSPGPSDNPSEIARFELWERMRAGFAKILEANQLTLAEAKSIAQHSRLVGMKEFRTRTQMSERTFRNWWNNFTDRPSGAFRRSGRRHRPTQNCMRGRCVRWLEYQFDRLFRHPSICYSSREMWETCKAAGGFPTCSYRTFRRVLEKLNHCSGTQYEWWKKQAQRERRTRYLRERSKRKNARA
ncbi:MAG: hypothetical protein HZA32_16780 [Opitutae bacterium]|nr:hypothetical protein [Opitutae bacterium]